MVAASATGGLGGAGRSSKKMSGWFIAKTVVFTRLGNIDDY